MDAWISDEWRVLVPWSGLPKAWDAMNGHKVCLTLASKTCKKSFKQPRPKPKQCTQMCNQAKAFTVYTSTLCFVFNVFPTFATSIYSYHQNITLQHLQVHFLRTIHIILLYSIFISPTYYTSTSSVRFCWVPGPVHHKTISFFLDDLRSHIFLRPAD